MTTMDEYADEMRRSTLPRLFCLARSELVDDQREYPRCLVSCHVITHPPPAPPHPANDDDTEAACTPHAASNTSPSCERQTTSRRWRVPNTPPPTYPHPANDKQRQHGGSVCPTRCLQPPPHPPIPRTTNNNDTEAACT